MTLHNNDRIFDDAEIDKQIERKKHLTARDIAALDGEELIRRATKVFTEAVQEALAENARLGIDSPFGIGDRVAFRKPDGTWYFEDEPDKLYPADEPA